MSQRDFDFKISVGRRGVFRPNHRFSVGYIRIIYLFGPFHTKSYTRKCFVTDAVWQKPVKDTGQW